MKTYRNVSPKFSGGRLAKNTFWNIGGAGLPLVVGAVAIPKIIAGLGTERFGVLTLAWMLIGYFSLFDMGLGQALTKLVSEKLGAQEEEEIPALSITALVIMCVLGFSGGLIIMSAAGPVVGSLLKIPPSLQHETKVAFRLLGATIPLVVMTAGLTGILQAYHRFPQINAVRIPLGIWNFMAPAILLPFSPTVVSVTAALVFGRIIAWCIYFYFFLKLVRPQGLLSSFNSHFIRPLMSFGGWMAISNIISPVMVYLDRFIIGTVVSVAAVAYYATPSEVIYRLSIMPIGLVTVLFPAITQTLAEDRLRAAQLFNRGSEYIFIVFFPLVLLIVTFAGEGLNVWVGREFASHSTFVLQCLAVGIFFNSLARTAHIMVQAAGRPDLVAKLHSVEMPCYLLLLWLLLNRYGINGAAVAWTARVIIDALALFYLAGRNVSEAVPGIVKLGRAAFVAAACFAAPVFLPDLLLRSLLVFIVFTAFAIHAWRKILGQSEKKWLTRRLAFSGKV